eukprot:TRINITY_DN10120_c0_g1_i1.p1 TRINITY_DN10120_c0_g1~~TRINITY_DN10120_c0_g1_i1.p1  ORF type:complete len:716 (-),score=94.99 TRINITY_DN10120_c0_g1_i1:94-2241(-)
MSQEGRVGVAGGPLGSASTVGAVGPTVLGDNDRISTGRLRTERLAVGIDAAVCEMERIKREIAVYKDVTLIASGGTVCSYVGNGDWCATSDHTSSATATTIPARQLKDEPSSSLVQFYETYLGPTKSLVDCLYRTASDIISSLHQTKGFVALLNRYDIDLSSHSCGFFEILPSEIKQHIFSYLRPYDIVTKVLLLNKRLHYEVDNDGFWRSVCVRHFTYRRHNITVPTTQHTTTTETTTTETTTKAKTGTTTTNSTTPYAHNYNGDAYWRQRYKEFHEIESNWFTNRCNVLTIPTSRRVYSVVFSEERGLLWSGNAKGWLQRYDLETGAPQKQISIHGGAVNCIKLGTRIHGFLEDASDPPVSESDWHHGLNQADSTMSSSADLIFSCSNDGTIKVWDANFTSDAEAPLLVLDAASAPTNNNNNVDDVAGTVGLQLGRERVYSCGLDRSIRVFDVNDGNGGGGKAVRTMFDTSSLRCLQVDHRETGGTGCIVTGGSDGYIKLWDARVSSYNGCCVASLRTGLAKVMTLQLTEAARPWQGGSGYNGCPECDLLKLHEHAGAAKQHTLWGGVRPLVVGGDSAQANTVLFLASPDLRMLHDSSTEPFRLIGHSDRVWSMQSTGSRIVTGSRDNSVRVWNLMCRHQAVQIDKHQHLPCFPIGNTQDDSVYVQKYPLGNRKEQHLNSIYWLQFSHRRLVTASADHTIKIWDFSRQHVKKN